MNNKLLMSLLSLVLLGVSCTSSIKVSNSTAKTTEISGAGVTYRPVIADLDVLEEKVSGEVKSSSIEDNLDDLKQSAITDALSKQNADVLVEPKFKIVSVSNHRTVTVSGYPGTYKNFRSATLEDKELLEVQKVGSVETKEINDSKKESSKGVGLILGTVAVVGLVALLIPLF